jgi:hypothetical protein
MCVCWKSRARIAAVAFTAAALAVVFWSPASAEPVRITVDFRVMGDLNPGGASPADSVYGMEKARGSFSILAYVPAGGGQIEDFERGLGADAISFSWAGTEWTTGMADVSALVFDPHGTLVYWQLAGLTGGLGDISPHRGPDIYVDPFAFLYVAGRHLFEGSVISTAVAGTQSPGPAPSPGPEPVPEPASVALVASGLLALLGTRRWSIPNY